MEKEFDFKQIGKRMPYQVPDDFFDTMEQRVLEQVQHTPAKPKTRTIAIRSLIAVAAAIALFFVVKTTLPASTTDNDNYASVELAFNNLSTDDQDFLMAVYEEDLFMNETENEEEL